LREYRGEVPGGVGAYGNIVGHISDKVIIIIIIMQRLMRHVSVIRMTNRSYSEVSSSNSSGSE